jgi:zinc transport system ATP-binding protein
MHELTHKENVIELEHVVFAYGDETVLSDITLEVHRGDYLGIIGPNGSGKSTLLKIMLGLLPPKTGLVKLFGTEVRTFKDWTKIGYVSQKATQIDPNFPLTVEEVVSMGRYNRKGLFQFLDELDRKKVSEALKHVEMEEYRTRLIGDLSGGQTQRVFIARALAGEPEVIVLDEPTAGVDAKTQEQLYALLRKLNREMDLTLVLVSHDLEVVEREASELLCLNRSVAFFGLAKDFKAHANYAEFSEDTGKFTHHAS